MLHVCARPCSLEKGESDYFYLSDFYFWELVSTLASVCPPHFTEQIHLQRHQHRQTPVTAPCFGGTLTGMCSFPCVPTMLQEDPEIQPRQVIYRSYESSFHPLFLIYQNSRVQSGTGKEAMLVLTHDHTWHSHLARSIGRVFILSKGTLLIFSNITGWQGIYFSFCSGIIRL